VDESAFVSAISALEVAQKHARGRLVLSSRPARWFPELLDRHGLREVEIVHELAIAAYDLPGDFHADPADRIIVATARLLDLAVVTSDRRILGWAAAGHVEVLGYGTTRT
jgi:PIN domain nuclease of toxin-antitoxin system